MRPWNTAISADNITCQQNYHCTIPATGRMDINNIAQQALRSITVWQSDVQQRSVLYGWIQVFFLRISGSRKFWPHYYRLFVWCMSGAHTSPILKVYMQVLTASAYASSDRQCICKFWPPVHILTGYMKILTSTGANASSGQNDLHLQFLTREYAT